MKDMMKNTGRVLAPLAVYLGISILVTMACVWVYMMMGYENQEEISATLVTTLTAACSIPPLWRMWKQDRILLGSYVKEKKCSWWALACAFLGGAAASLAGAFLIDGLGIKEYFSNQTQEQLFSANLLLQLAGLCVIVPFAEELIYRGLFYQRLLEYVPRWAAIAAASLVFALGHGNMVQFLYALPMALLLHWIYEWCGSLRGPVLFHMGANLISVVVEYLA